MTAVPSVFDLLRDAAGGATWLLNFHRSVELGFMPTRVQAVLYEELTRLQSAAVGATAAFDSMRQLLTSASGAESHDQLCNCFRAAYPQSFAVLKVVTRDTYENYYIENGESRAAGRTQRLQSPIDDREPEFMPPAQADRTGAEFPPLPLRPEVTLAPPDGVAFVTDVDGWNARQATGPDSAQGAESGASNLADAAMLWLGLSYSTGTRLVAMSVQMGLDLGAAGCRRPTLLDAGAHPWWLCWPDDPPHMGHTVDLSRIASGSVQRGAREWVMNPVQISTAGGAVQAQHLGQTTVDTLGSNDALRRQFDAAAEGIAS